MNVEIKQLPALRVAAVRHIGPYNQVTEAFDRLGGIADRAGMFDPTPPMMVALYHDDPNVVPPDQLTSDAGLVVPEGTTLPAGMEEQRVPAGTYACAVHVGPYEKLGDAWDRFVGELIPASGKHMVDGTSYEVYLNNPMQVKKEDLLTEMRVPVA